MRDSRVVRHSLLFHRAEQNEILKKPKVVIDNLRVRPLLLGDGGYLLWKWLMKPYSLMPALNNIEKGSTRSFHLLVQLLKDRLVSARYNGTVVENVLNVIISCFVLHNCTRLMVKLTLTRPVYLSI